jgi:putative FmdB family regulatory protein
MKDADRGIKMLIVLSRGGKMPLYAFHCQQCDRDHELLLGLEEAEGARCPECGGALDRRLTAPAAYRNTNPRPHGKTCCGREERCDTPPCGEGGQSGCCHQ